jgi:hypothetical protein
MDRRRQEQCGKLVFVAVMYVGIMQVSVKHFWMPVPVAVRHSCRYGLFMFVPVVFVVDVRVFVRSLCVPVVVPVPFSKVEPEAETHQPGSREKVNRHGIAQNENGNRRSNERSHGKIRAGPSRSNVAQR